LGAWGKPDRTNEANGRHAELVGKTQRNMGGGGENGYMTERGNKHKGE